MRSMPARGGRALLVVVAAAVLAMAILSPACFATLRRALRRRRQPGDTHLAEIRTVAELRAATRFYLRPSHLAWTSTASTKSSPTSSTPTAERAIYQGLIDVLY